MNPVGKGPNALRSMNRAVILELLRRNSTPTTVAQLAEASALSRPAVTRAVADLDAHGLLERLDTAPLGSVGRPAQRIRFAADKGAVAGMHVSPDRVHVLLADLGGRVVSDVTVETTPHAEDVLDTAVAALHNALSSLGGRTRLWGIGVGTPGLVDPSDGHVRIAPSIPGWSKVPVDERLRREFGCAVAIDNDVNLAAVGEHARGGARDLADFAYVYWDDRVGVGLVLGGRPYRGAGLAAGELGFVDLVGDIDRPRSRAAGGAGSFELLVCVPAIAKLASKQARAAKDKDLLAHLKAAEPGGALTALVAAAATSKTAETVLGQVVSRFCVGLAALVMIVDPGTVVLGGRAATAGEPLRERVEAELAARTLHTPTVLLSWLGDDAVALGGLQQAGELVDRCLADKVG